MDDETHLVKRLLERGAVANVREAQVVERLLYEHFRSGCLEGHLSYAVSKKLMRRYEELDNFYRFELPSGMFYVLRRANGIMATVYTQAMFSAWRKKVKGRGRKPKS